MASHGPPCAVWNSPSGPNRPVPAPQDTADASDAPAEPKEQAEAKAPAVQIKEARAGGNSKRCARGRRKASKGEGFLFGFV